MLFKHETNQELLNVAECNARQLLIFSVDFIKLVGFKVMNCIAKHGIWICYVKGAGVVNNSMNHRRIMNNPPVMLINPNQSVFIRGEWKALEADLWYN